MLYEIARSIVQRIFQDKILAGLVIVGILAIFVGGFGGGNSGDRIATGPRDQRVRQSGGNGSSEAMPPERQAQPPQAQKAEKPKAPAKPAPPAKLEPSLATQFIGWWIAKGMDFNPQSAVANRQEAANWVVPEVQPNYQAAFWPPEIAESILSGRVRGQFTPTSVQAIASNPDGSIVVNVTGQLCLQQGPRPVIQHLSTDYLVKRDSSGLRIAGLFNRATAVPSSSVY